MALSHSPPRPFERFNSIKRLNYLSLNVFVNIYLNLEAKEFHNLRVKPTPSAPVTQAENG